MDYNSDRAKYWRNCDLWSFSEIQCLLNGEWPDECDHPPSSLTICLLQLETKVTHDLGDGTFLDQNEVRAISPVPDGVGLPQMIEAAIAAGKLTPISHYTTPRYKHDLEPKFRPDEVIAWAISRGCFPDFPFAQEEQTVHTKEREDADHKEAAAWFEYWIERDQREAAEERIKELEAQSTPSLLNDPAGAVSESAPTESSPPSTTGAQAPATTNESAEQRQARRYQMCIDAGLNMPVTDYGPMPRGIGKIAKSEGKTRQAFTEDVRKHIARMKQA